MQNPPPPPPPLAPVPYAAPPAYATQATYAGFWIRLVARLVDGLIIGIPFAILFTVFAVIGGVFANAANSANSSSQSAQGATAAIFGGTFILLYLIALVVQVGYWIYFWGSSGSTLGMRLLRLRVVDANTGGPIGYTRALVRFLMTIVNSWACYIGWIWVAFDSRKQGWHDKVASSVVLHY